MSMIPIPAPKLLISYNEPEGGYYIQLVEYPSGLQAILEGREQIEFIEPELPVLEKHAIWIKRLNAAWETCPALLRFV